MQRVWRTPDPDEAMLLASFLRANGLHAWAFDHGMVRLDWLKALAFGGCRIMVDDDEADRARSLLADWRSRALEVPAEPGDQPICPRSGHEGEVDPVPRRIAFAGVIAFCFLPWALPLDLGLEFAGASIESRTLVAVLPTLAWSAIAVPLIVTRLLRDRYWCPACGHRWRAHAEPWVRLAAAVDKASDQTDARAALD